ncbi:MAG TPA: hypothetical protein VIG78_06090 [Gemmatimonadaceae bacterium]
MRKEDRKWDFSLGVAFAALVVAGITFYFQFLHVRDADIAIISDNEEQGTVPRPYRFMPASSQADFPEYKEEYPFYALVRLVFANTGDCPGFVRMIDPIQATMEHDGRNHRLAVANYTYTLLPGHSIVDRAIMLRNIPPLSGRPATVRLTFTLETGGSCRKTPTRRQQSRMTAILYPAADTPEMTATTLKQ